MLTKNGKLLFKAEPLYPNNNYTTYISYTGHETQWSHNVCAFWKLDVGSGTAEPTANDYNMLETSLSGVLTRVDGSAAHNDSVNNNYMASWSATYKNNTDQPITVTEIGVWYYNTYQDWTDGHPQIILVAHELLEEPKVIQPGESYAFSITVG